MAVILPFAHADTPSASNASSDTRPSDARIIGSRHLCGTDPRWRHFSSAESRTPSDRASSSITSQSIDCIVVMMPKIADKSSACQGHFGGRPNSLKFIKLDMAKRTTMPDTTEREEDALHLRVKKMLEAYRESKGWNQERMGEFLGVGKANYQKYAYYHKDTKIRRVPIIVIARFCEYTGNDLGDIILGPHRTRKSA